PTLLSLSLSFFFNDPPTTEIYTLSLHDALPICRIMPTSWLSSLSSTPIRVAAISTSVASSAWSAPATILCSRSVSRCTLARSSRSEEHTSELQSRGHLVCRLLLEKKKNTYTSRR